MSAAVARPLAPRDAEGGAARRAEAQALLARRAPCGAALAAALGPDAAAFALGLTPAALARLADGSPSVRRRLHARLCERLGLPAADAEAMLAGLPRTEPGLARAAFAFAVTLEIAAAPRVLARAACDRLVAAYGPAAIGFALERRGRLRGAPDAGSGETPAPALARRAATLLVAALADAGHPLAGAVAARLAEPLPSGPDTTRAGVPQRLAVALEALAAFRAEEDAVAPAAREPAPPEPFASSEQPRVSAGATLG